MNFLATSQNIHELLDFSSNVLVTLIGGGLVLAGTMTVILSLTRGLKVFITGLLLGIAGFGVTMQFGGAAEENNQKINDLASIIDSSLHEKYDFTEYKPHKIEINTQTSEVTKREQSFEARVFNSEIIDAPTVNVVLNDDTRVTWGIIGDPDTGEVEFIGDGNINPDDILKESK